MHRQELLNLLKQHRTRFMDEAGYISRAIAFVEEHEDIFYRHLWPAHVTGSSWVVSPDRERVLMLHHRKHDEWYQPGGHADGDNDVLRVALRETSEETGLDSAHINLIDENVFDVDIHTISASDEAPRHEHIDIRFLVEIDDSLFLPGSDESHDVIWVDFHDVSRFNNNRSTYRMVEKTRRLRRNLVA
ncbi:MAG: NUDIX domain-containing protein [Gammaproteobacteria bacterium]|nr:MAG: NUDIX domain-containing protein [Gammaproteobacteria bacterium]